MAGCCSMVDCYCKSEVDKVLVVGNCAEYMDK